MICKDCGATLGAKDTVCPHCGAPVQPSGSDATGDVGSGLMGTVGRVGLPVVVCCALSAACLLGTLIGGVVSMGAAQSTRADLQKQVNALSEEVDSLKALVGDMHDAQSSMQIEVVRNPSNATKPVGYVDDEESKLFALEVNGKVKSFSWQKLQGETGTWEDLQFDEGDYYDSRYGLRLEEDLEAGTSALSAAGLVADSAGTYRCVVQGVYGDELTCSATLLILPEGDQAQVEADATYTDETYEDASGEAAYGDEYYAEGETSL